MNILIGEGKNNFIVECNTEKAENSEEEATLTGDAPSDDAPADDNSGGGSGGDNGGLFPGFLDASAN
jgi:hypothetical protein